MIRILRRLFHMMEKYKGRLYFGIVLSMINNMLGIVPIVCGVWTIKAILDDASGTAVLDKNYVFSLIGIIVGSILLRWFFAYLRAARQDSIAHEVTTSERLKIGDILKRVSLGFLQTKNNVSFGYDSREVLSHVSFHNSGKSGRMGYRLDGRRKIHHLVFKKFPVLPKVLVITLPAASYPCC